MDSPPWWIDQWENRNRLQQIKDYLNRYLVRHLTNLALTFLCSQAFAAAAAFSGSTCEVVVTPETTLTSDTELARSALGNNGDLWSLWRWIRAVLVQNMWNRSKTDRYAACPLFLHCYAPFFPHSSEPGRMKRLAIALVGFRTDQNVLASFERLGLMCVVVYVLAIS